MDAEDGRYMTERDIRAAVGDNIGTVTYSKRTHSIRKEHVLSEESVTSAPLSATILAR